MWSFKVVNVVGSGDISRELDLDAVSQAVKDETGATQVSKSSQGLKIEFRKRAGTILLYRSGKYTIMGSDSEEELFRTNATFLELFVELDIITDTSNTSLRVANYVYAVDIEKDVNLSHLDILLGDEAEYEPEQFPYIVYRPSDIDCTMTISASGKCVINTPIGNEAVESVLERLLATIESNPVE